MKPAYKTTESKSPTAILITEMLAQTGLYQKDILALMPKGKQSNAFLSLLKSGSAKMPVDFVIPFCNAIGATKEKRDELARTVLSEYHGDILNLISTVEGTVIDEDEERLLRIYRSEKRKAMERHEAENEEKKQQLLEEGVSLKEVKSLTQQGYAQLSTQEEKLKDIRNSIFQSFEF